jgi:hypothetical protein
VFLPEKQSCMVQATKLAGAIMNQNDLNKLLQQAHDYGEPGIVDPANLRVVQEMPLARAFDGWKAVLVPYQDDQDADPIVLFGPKDTNVKELWKAWWEEKVAKLVGTSPWNEWNRQDAGTERVKQLRLELEARRSSINKLRDEYSIEVFGVEGRTWGQIFAKVLCIEHGFYELEFETNEFYPEAEW